MGLLLHYATTPVLHTGRLCLLAALVAVPACPRVWAQSIICFEAESSADVSAPVKAARPGTRSPATDAQALRAASGRGYLEIPEGSGNPPEIKAGSARFAFDIREAGKYYLWCRVWWDNECGNSLRIGIDEARSFTFGQDATYKRWHWVKAPPRLKQLNLSRGGHALTVLNREDGIKLDQLLLVNSRHYVPVGIEESTGGPAQETDPQ